MTGRRIDHLVMPFEDMAAAADLFTKLGFKVGSRNRHPWGTENHIIQFPGSFLELITVGEGASFAPHAQRHFSFGQHVADWLQAKQEPMSMLVLSSTDAQGDARTFADRGIGDFDPFDFRRQGKRPDGSTVEVAFTLAFADSKAMPDHGFFVCQQHFPENFWSEAAQQHANGVKRLERLEFHHPVPAEMRAFMEAFSGATASQTAGGLRLKLQDQQIDFQLSASTRPACSMIVFEAADLVAVERQANKAGLHSTSSALKGRRHLLVSAPQLGSMMLAFIAGAT
jgi:Glyoxalase-like domain